MEITEAYVSFETAKLLKEKGFDCETDKYYSPEGRELTCLDDRDAEELGYVKRPTLQLACKWLREVHNLCIEPYRTACGYLYTISTIPYGTNLYSDHYKGNDEDSGQWTTYEKAVEAAIKYCLENLIK